MKNGTGWEDALMTEDQVAKVVELIKQAEARDELWECCREVFEGIELMRRNLGTILRDGISDARLSAEPATWPDAWCGAYEAFVPMVNGVAEHSNWCAYVPDEHWPGPEDDDYERLAPLARMSVEEVRLMPWMWRVRRAEHCLQLWLERINELYMQSRG